MVNQVTEASLRQFWTEVADQSHAMAGAVIAASAAQAVALGTACMRISLEQQAGRPEAREVPTHLARLVNIRESLAQWCDRDATAIAEFVALREAGRELAGQQLLCEAPATIGHLVLEAAELLQNFRPLVVEQVQDDLEMSIVLLAGTARAAILLLDSNLRLWPEPALLAQFEPALVELIARTGQLIPVDRIR
jgi:formiminotetrahydrofolate cyclodeaminase